MHLDEYAYDWALTNQSKTTLYNYLGYLRDAERTCGLPLDLSSANTYLTSKLELVSPATLHVIVRALKNFHRWYAHTYEVPDPLAKLAYPKVSTPPPGKIATDADILKLLSANPGSDFLSVRNRTIVKVLRD